MAIYELDGQAPEFPADGLYWVADTASVIGKVQAPYQCQHLVRLGAARRQ